MLEFDKLSTTNDRSFGPFPSSPEKPLYIIRERSKEVKAAWQRIIVGPQLETVSIALGGPDPRSNRLHTGQRTVHMKTDGSDISVRQGYGSQPCSFFYGSVSTEGGPEKIRFFPNITQKYSVEAAIHLAGHDRLHIDFEFQRSAEAILVITHQALANIPGTSYASFGLDGRPLTVSLEELLKAVKTNVDKENFIVEQAVPTSKSGRRIIRRAVVRPLE